MIRKAASQYPLASSGPPEAANFSSRERLTEALMKSRTRRPAVKADPKLTLATGCCGR
jgi:hypothetical protein